MLLVVCRQRGGIGAPVLVGCKKRGWIQPPKCGAQRGWVRPPTFAPPRYSRFLRDTYGDNVVAAVFTLSCGGGVR